MPQFSEDRLELLVYQARSRITTETLAAAMTEQINLHGAAGDREKLPVFVRSYMALSEHVQTLSVTSSKSYEGKPALYLSSLSLFKACLGNLERLSHEHRHGDERLRSFVTSLLRFRSGFLELATPLVLQLDQDAVKLFEGHTARKLAPLLSKEESPKSFAVRLMDAVNLEREDGPEIFADLLMRYATV